MISRRDFLKIGAVAAGSTVLPLATTAEAHGSQQVPQTPLAPKKIPQFVDPMPHFAGARVPANGSMTISMENHVQQVLPAAMYPAGVSGTSVWAYKITDAAANVYGPNYPAFSLEATRGTPVDIHYVNNLSNNLYRLLTVDQTLHWADPEGLGHAMMVTCPVPPPGTAADPHCQFYTGQVPVSPHLHGGEVASVDDGGPDSWFTPGLLKTGSAWGQGVTDYYHYPNEAETGTVWWHDHALGVTRLNVYAGLAGYYLIRDEWDTGVPGSGANFPAGAQEIEIAIQDRMFDTNGQWLFPDLGLNPEHPYWVPEFLGDCIVVNGKTWPYLNVTQQRYRFRLLNGSNARTYELALVDPVTKNPGPPIWVIGCDSNLNSVAAKIDPAAAVNNKLAIMPGERYDIIVDFAGYGAGTNPSNGLAYSGTFVLKNTAKSPYPAGAAPQGSTLGQIMQFRVAAGTVVDTSYDPAGGASPRQTPAVQLSNWAGGLATGVVPDVKRQLTLNEVMGMPMAPWIGGPLEILVNNTKWDGMMSPGVGDGEFGDGVTENPRVGATELWQIINLTADAHPIHTHLVQFQLVSRQAFDVKKYLAAYGLLFPGGAFVGGYGPPNAYLTANADGAVGGNPAVTPYLKGPLMAPLPQERGWKDTVMMLPGQVSTFIARWAPTSAAKGTTASGTNLYSFDPTEGPGYVWHCHIIDHEDNEMMRPQKVRA